MNQLEQKWGRRGIQGMRMLKIILVVLQYCFGYATSFTPIAPRSISARGSGTVVGCNLLGDDKSTSTSTSTSTTNNDLSLEEDLLRHLWDQKPFQVVTDLVTSVVSLDDGRNAAISQPWLTRVTDGPSNHNDDNDDDGDEYGSFAAPIRPEHNALFHRLFETSSSDNKSHDPNLQNVALSSFDDTHSDHHQLTAGNANVVADHPKKAFSSFALEVAYKGDHFCGWQTQPNNHERPSVQQTLEDWLQPLYEPSRRVKKNNNNNTNTNNANNKQPRVNIRVSGRTDAGVHAVGQMARFRTWTKGGGRGSGFGSEWNHLTNRTRTFVEEDTDDNSNTSSSHPEEQLLRYINQHPLAGTSFRCLSVLPVSTRFHPTFGASCRAYIYLIDAKDIDDMLRLKKAQTNNLDTTEQLVRRVNAMLKTLEGQELDYVAMSYGKVKTQSTLCTMHLARAFLVKTNNNDLHDDNSTASFQSPPTTALCIQLVGNRFLRRMVRILVATALREAMMFMSNEGGDDLNDSSNNIGLVRALETLDRTQMARPAPPQGLVFVGAQFDSSVLQHDNAFCYNE